MSAKKSRNVQGEQQSHIKKAYTYSNTVPPHEHDWPRRLAITVRIKDESITITRTIVLSMPYTDIDTDRKIFHASIIRDKRRTDCLMDRKGYLQTLKMLSSISFPFLQPSQSPASTMSRDFLFAIELGELCCPQRTRFQWKNPDQGTSHCLEYIWEFFGRVIRERNPDIQLDDLMPCD